MPSGQVEVYLYVEKTLLSYLDDIPLLRAVHESRVSWSYESNELLDVVESFLHNIVTPCPQLCGRHTGGLHHPLSFAIWQHNAAALLIIVKL